MQFTCSQFALRRALSQVAHAHAAHASLPILATICLCATEPSRVLLRSTDLSLGIEVSVQGARVDQGGEAAILSRPFAAWVASQEATSLQFFGTSDQVVGQAGRHRASFHTMSAADYPVVIPQVQEGAALLLETTRLKEMLSLVVPAAAEEEKEGTAIFTGVLVQVQGHRMRLVASDRTLLAQSETLLPRTNGQSRLLLPATSLAKLVRLLPLDGMVEVSLTQQGNQAVFKCNGLAFSTTVLAGSYPAYEHVIPPASERVTRVLLSRSALYEALAQVRPFARSASEEAVRLQITSNALVLSVRSDEVGSAHSSCEAQVNGPQMALTFSCASLVMMVSRLLSAHVLLEVTPGRPMILRAAGEKTQDCFVLMPLEAMSNPPGSANQEGEKAKRAEEEGGEGGEGG